MEHYESVDIERLKKCNDVKLFENFKIFCEFCKKVPVPPYRKIDNEIKFYCMKCVMTNKSLDKKSIVEPCFVDVEIIKNLLINCKSCKEKVKINNIVSHEMSCKEIVKGLCRRCKQIRNDEHNCVRNLMEILVKQEERLNILDQSFLNMEKNENLK